jgi:nicotinate phosphoribosyltransferase
VSQVIDRTPSTALLTDRYELTMLDAAIESGVAGRRAVFEVFARVLPPGRRYGVVAGIGRVIDALDQFRFGGDEIAWLVGDGIVSEETGEWLRSFRFSGDLDAYAEGECYFPGSPVITIESSFGEAVLLETVVLSILNHDSAVAAAASRMVGAAEGRPVIEMGSRRTHEQAAVAAARAAYIAGCSSTSNLEAGRLYGVPTAGTAAHAFVLAHPDESAAFAAQLDAMGTSTTLLVDTYDVERAIRTAVELARDRGAEGPGAIRLDSGDLLDQAERARALLDELGATATGIIITSDLDEYSIAALARGPVDGYGVGTRLVTGSGAPTAGFVYKLVAVAAENGRLAQLRPVEKRSPAKHNLGARKHASRWIDDEGRARVEFVRPLLEDAEKQVARVAAGDRADIDRLAADGVDPSALVPRGRDTYGVSRGAGRVRALAGVPGVSGGSAVSAPGGGSGGPDDLPDELPEGWEARDLQRRWISEGRLVEPAPSLIDSREHHRWALRELGAEAFDLHPGSPVIPTRYGRGPNGDLDDPESERPLATVSEIRPGAGRAPVPPKPSAPRSSTALLVVDLQRDFCEGGALAVAGGDSLAGRVAEYAANELELEIELEHGRYAAVVASRDTHVNPGTHFAQPGTTPDFETSWPVHCVVGSEGAELHPAVAGIEWDAIFDKGREEAALSAFEGSEAAGAALAQWLLDHGIDRLDVCGIATDYCVRSTVLDARQLGFHVRVLVDLTTGVSPATTEKALREMAEAGAQLVGDDISPGTVAGMLAEQLAFDDR